MNVAVDGVDGGAVTLESIYCFNSEIFQDESKWDTIHWSVATVGGKSTDGQCGGGRGMRT